MFKAKQFRLATALTVLLLAGEFIIGATRHMLAQQNNPGVQQSGAVTAGHLATWGPGIGQIQDGGTIPTTVTSVFGRTGAVVATFGDYSFGLISGALFCAQLPTFTGDVTDSGCAMTLATVNANVGSFGGANSIPSFTVNGKGLITAASANTPSISALGGLQIGNCTIAASVASNNLTISIVDATGSALSATSPCSVVERSATATNGALTTRVLTSATTLVLNSGSTLGTSNNVPFRVWIELFDTGSTAVLAASVQSTSTDIFPLDEYDVASSTACNACGTATSAGVFYTTAAQTSQPWRIFGYLDWSSGLATAGAWASGPTKIQEFGPGIPRPGQVVKSTQFTTASVKTIQSLSYVDTNCTKAITPTSSINFISTFWNGEVQGSVATDTLSFQLARSGTPVGPPKVAAGSYIPAQLFNDAPGTTSAVTYTVQGKNTSSATNAVFFPNSTGGCVLQLAEIMG